MIARPHTVSNGAAQNGRALAPVHVALYSRKSSERGMEQEYNSIDAQRGILEAFVADHADEGWVALPDEYSDGGVSGATLNRPGLKRLLADITAGKVNVVAVYRLDRLSRDTAGFLELMTFLKAHDVEVVSPNDRIEQATATDRLQLGIRMHISQYERELAGERIRDKMRASRRQGLWQGGRPPLGYDVVTKKLVVNEPEAGQVRDAFEAFQRTGSLVETLDELTRRGIRTKSWITQKSRHIEGKPFGVHTLRRLLSNVLYTGQQLVEGQPYRAEHDPIVEQELWNDVQRLIVTRKRGERRRKPKRSRAALQGLLKCGVCGAGMLPTYSAKRGRRYSYYVCHTMASRGAAACPGSRIPAGDMEASVVEQLRTMGRNPEVVAATVAEARVQVEARQQELTSELRRARANAKRLNAERDNLLQAVQKGGKDVPALVETLRTAEQTAGEADEHVTSVRVTLKALKAQVIDEADLAQALADFEPVWEAIFPDEKARVLNLLLERVVYDAPTSSVRLTFWSEGVRSLLDESTEATA